MFLVLKTSYMHVWLKNSIFFKEIVIIF